VLDYELERQIQELLKKHPDIWLGAYGREVFRMRETARNRFVSYGLSSTTKTPRS
jgi:hypothetical protein